ncbi:glycosyl transferase family 1 [Mucilaginibacter sp. PAMC 26640]|nr:glycosyl transferase family 1 [Mucilaginibacter sp. PAMC 26640]
MRIAIIGTRGIPNHYGGFEQCAEYLAVGLVKKGYEVVVYNSHTHPYKGNSFQGVEICHQFDPEDKIGTAGQFIYDLNCIRDLRKRNVDVVLQLGYCSSSVWGWLMPQNAVITTNMDGLEWTRTKYSKPVQRFLRQAEKLGVKYSDHLIADSPEIKRYLEIKYGKQANYIPYGAELFEKPCADILADYELNAFNYDMLVARMEPENSIEIILDGVVKAGLNRPFLVIGCANNAFTNYLKNKFKSYNQIMFHKGIYNMDTLNNLRYYANLYFHGHTVGGTNPSLLESMASNSLICSHQNKFNSAVLGTDALYFSTANDVAGHLLTAHKNSGDYDKLLLNNRIKIKEIYSVENIVNAYASHFEAIVCKRMPQKQQRFNLGKTEISLR